MAFIKSGQTQLPKDAVIIDEIEATTYIWDIVSNWHNTSDTWALRFGAVALGAINSFTGGVINQHYRWKLKLGNYGFFSSSIPIVIMPGILTIVFHKHMVTTDILLSKSKNCPICYEVKSSAIQWTLGILYPMVLGPTSALMFANRYSTYRVPNLFEGPKVMFNFLRKHSSKSLTGPLAYLAVLQLAASATVTYYELRNNMTLKNKLRAIEQKLDEGKIK